MKVIGIILLLFAFHIVGGTAAQPPTCPTDVLLDFARAGSACYGMESESICVGNGTASVEYHDGTRADLIAGDTAEAASVASLSLAMSDETPIAWLNIRGGLTELDAREVAIRAYGDVTIRNPIAPLMTLAVMTTGAANARSYPNASSEIVARFGVNDGLIANGRTVDSDWIRVQIPNTNDLGWITRDVLTTQGNLASLTATDPATSSILRPPFSQFGIEIGAGVLCGGDLPSGVLIQSPNSVDPVDFTLNDIPMRAAGTLYISDGAVDVIHGWALFDRVFVLAGARYQAGAIAPFDPSLIPVLPFTSLPRVVTLPTPITADQLAAAQAEYLQAQIPTPTPAPTNPAEDRTCRRIVQRDATLYAGAGDFYEAINEIEAGASVDPVFQTLDPDGGVWWQLRGSNWIAAALVRETGNCQPIPVMDRVVPPNTNTLSLETCESTNGPVRAGQRVEIFFIPPAFQSYAEAEEAPRIDPGRITIGARTYRAQVGEMIRLGTVGTEDRYLRRFSYFWRAVAGTHRIVGDRLHYIPICTITVPVG